VVKHILNKLLKAIRQADRENVDFAVVAVGISESVAVSIHAQGPVGGKASLNPNA
jgi:hypothetical protein